MTFCSIWQFNIDTFWTARIWPAWSFNSDRTKHTPSDFQCHICLASVVFLRLFFKLKVSSWAFLEARQIFLETHCRFELNFMTSWGMVSDKVIVVSADEILEVSSADTTITLSFLHALSAATTKDDDYGREWHRCRWCTTLVKRKPLRFLRIDHEWSPFVLLFFRKARQPPSGPEVKWDA